MFNKLFTAIALASVVTATLVDLNTSPDQAKKIISNTKFDYIIVGGGTAGLTIARRLSELPITNVLVLEAGGSGVNNTKITIPKNSFAFVATELDWFYFSSPQVHAGNSTINDSQGKILGGDSAVNGLVWVRPPVAELDAFEELGNPGWNWDTLYPAMKKSETLNSPSAVQTKEYGQSAVAASHGTSGPIDVSFPPYLPIQHQKLVEASLELGHNLNADPYSGNNTGVFYSLSSQTKQGVRESSEFAYLDPVLGRTNLVVFSHAMVTKLDISSAFLGIVRASGVDVRFPDGSVETVETTIFGEVIMTAGAIKTPQILELSGIGDSNVLTPRGIDVKLSLPGVGANFEDHIISLLTYKMNPGFLSFDALDYNATLLAEQEALYKQGQGWLTFANGVINMQPIDVILTTAEIEEAKTILATKPPTISQEAFDIIKKQVFSGVPQVEFLIFNSFSAGDVKLANTSYISMAITVLHPLSRGSIHINTTSIDDHPIVNPNALESEWDLWLLAKATKYARKFFQTKAYKEIFDQEEVWPGKAVQTDEEFRAFVKANLNTGYHSVGTASLLPKDKGGVVDRNLRVYGTTNIRVADASVMPLLVSAHTQPIVYGIAEKAATIIQWT
ncbi:GMC oxidoreductase-domain-containing protein [Cyathus striatus]|nr:GMC oxidoreductase-domain-containing protein [Cyathus striatus]